MTNNEQYDNYLTVEGGVAETNLNYQGSETSEDEISESNEIETNTSNKIVDKENEVVVQSLKKNINLEYLTNYSFQISTLPDVFPPDPVLDFKEIRPYIKKIIDKISQLTGHTFSIRSSSSAGFVNRTYLKCTSDAKVSNQSKSESTAYDCLSQKRFRFKQNKISTMCQ